MKPCEVLVVAANEGQRRALAASFRSASIECVEAPSAAAAAQHALHPGEPLLALLLNDSLSNAPAPLLAMLQRAGLARVVLAGPGIDVAGLLHSLEVLERAADANGAASTDRLAATISSADGTPVDTAAGIALTLRESAPATHARGGPGRAGAGDAARLPDGSSRTGAAGITAREMEVLKLLALGWRNAQIARHLNVSAHTVRHQVSAILARLNSATRTEAVAAALRLGLV